MFKNTYQSGLLSIFYSCGANPLAIWDSEVNNGHIKRLTDNEVNSLVLEIVSTNIATTYISCPKNNQVLGIKLPFLVIILKNLKRYFSFEITILDDKNMRRRFRISNFQSTTKIKPFCTSMPIGLSGGWNQVQFNLADFTRRAYGSQFVEVLRVQIHANARLRRIYFSDRLYAEEELPQEYKLYLPLDRKQKKEKEKPEEKPAAAKLEAPEGAGERDKPAAPAKSAAKMEPLEAKTQPSAVTVKEEPVEEGAPPAEGEEAGEGTPAGETPGEPEAPADQAPAEGEAPAGEAPAGEAPAGEEPPAEGEAPTEAPAEASAETPAEAPEEAEAPPAE